ncbi:hypothetical protein DRJ17_07335 [Candidatus Woesearchaeota archaeon]|nr:MAG: hypothetical protein DRJ17_07335 [Candidatus Woesearchaeota archaeon]
MIDVYWSKLSKYMLEWLIKKYVSASGFGSEAIDPDTGSGESSAYYSKLHKNTIASIELKSEYSIKYIKALETYNAGIKTDHGIGALLYALYYLYDKLGDKNAYDTAINYINIIKNNLASSGLPYGQYDLDAGTPVTSAINVRISYLMHLIGAISLFDNDFAKTLYGKIPKVNEILAPAIDVTTGSASYTEDDMFAIYLAPAIMYHAYLVNQDVFWKTESESQSDLLLQYGWDGTTIRIFDPSTLTQITNQYFNVYELYFARYLALRYQYTGDDSFLDKAKKITMYAIHNNVIDGYIIERSGYNSTTVYKPLPEHFDALHHLYIVTLDERFKALSRSLIWTIWTQLRRSYDIADYDGTAYSSNGYSTETLLINYMIENDIKATYDLFTEMIIPLQ